MRIVCSGYLVREPVAGQTWHHLQYLVGFLRLGHEVTYVEDFGWEDSCYDPVADREGDDCRYGVDYARAVFAEHGVDSWCYVAADGTTHGASRDELAQACREADLHVELSGMSSLPELRLCSRRVYVDTDPVFTQIGAHGMVEPADFDVLFTFGERIGRPGSSVPDDGRDWLPTRQPIVLDLWPVLPVDGGPTTTVMNWSSFGLHEHAGELYGQKDREFAPFFSLPRETGEAMALAVSGAPAEIRERLVGGGWRIDDARVVSRDLRSYRDYIAASRSEFSVAKHGYVRTGCGWFSERTACYLASGRPAVVQDTGFSAIFPAGEGLHPFRTPAEARAGLRRVAADPERESRAARRVAEEWFDSETVLSDLLERALP